MGIFKKKCSKCGWEISYGSKVSLSDVIEKEIRDNPEYSYRSMEFDSLSGWFRSNFIYVIEFYDKYKNHTRYTYKFVEKKRSPGICLNCNTEIPFAFKKDIEKLKKYINAERKKHEITLLIKENQKEIDDYIEKMKENKS